MPVARFCAALVALACAGSVCSAGDDRFEISLRVYPADGRSGGVLTYRAAGKGEELRGPAGDARALHVIRREKFPGGERVYFRSTFTPGRVIFRGGDEELVLTFTGLPADADEDGFPDAAELPDEADRAAFRAWFVRISQSQYLKPSHAWQRDQRDCAGLIRFAYREALKRHDSAWQERAGVVLDKNLPDVRRFAYPDIPVLGERLFRIRPPAATDPGPLATAFAPFASAEYLMKYNTRPVSRELAAAAPGDLLFFRDLRRREGEGDFHSMIVTEPQPRPLDTIVIYHTGGPAGLKRVPAAYLMRLSDRRFHPLPENPYFLGVFRFLILD